MNCNISFKDLEIELKKRIVIPYTWKGKKQNNYDDERSDFIYTTPFFWHIQKIIKRGGYEDLSDYIINRWYNFWSAKAVESIFVQHKNIIAEKNVKNRYADFRIYDEDLGVFFDFDHKTTVLPKCFESKILDFLKKNTIKDLHIFDGEIIKWLYENQSQQQRKHWRNRFFVILVDSKGLEHWKLKSDLLFLHEKISKSLQNLKNIDFVDFIHNEKKVYSCVFWIVK